MGTDDGCEGDVWGGDVAHVDYCGMPAFGTDGDVRRVVEGGEEIVVEETYYDGAEGGAGEKLVELVGGGYFGYKVCGTEVDGGF